jgi:hypothetical protein
MAQAKRLRHLNFYLYFQNSKLDPGKWTFCQIYISVGMWKLEENEQEKGFDRIWGRGQPLEASDSGTLAALARRTTTPSGESL